MPRAGLLMRRPLREVVSSDDIEDLFGCGFGCPLVAFAVEVERELVVCEHGIGGEVGRVMAEIACLGVGVCGIDLVSVIVDGAGDVIASFKHVPGLSRGLRVFAIDGFQLLAAAEHIIHIGDVACVEA